MKIKLSNVRLSFPSLFETATYQGQDLGKYEATFLIPKDDPQAKVLQDAIKSIGVENFGKDWSKAKLCIADGDTKDLDGYAGNWSLKATTKKRPVVVDRDKTPLTAADDRMYAGCYVNVSAGLSAFQNSYGKFLVCNLNGVQFAADGDSFGGDGGNALDDFDDLGGVGKTDVERDDIPFDSDAPF